MGRPLVVIGSSNTDMVVKSDHLPGPGETVLGGVFMMNSGGKGANQAVAAARLGGKVALIASVGTDLFGRHALEQFRREGINTDEVFQNDTLPSGVALINVDRHGQNSISVAPGANFSLEGRAFEEAVNRIPQDALVLLQLEIPVQSVEYALTASRLAGRDVIFNPAPAAKIAPSALSGLFMITPNESEAGMLTGSPVSDERSARVAADILHSFGIRNVAITLGSKGAYLSGTDGGMLVAAPVVDAIDSTAAGDCFNGALAVAIAEGRRLREAVAYACRAASISVTRMGAQASMPFRQELDNN